jgi:hypothetical protein
MVYIPILVPSQEVCSRRPAKAERDFRIIRNRLFDPERTTEVDGDHLPRAVAELQ